MIAPPNSTSDMMKQSVGYTIAALESASELDMDLTEEERKFLASEKAGLEPLLERLMSEKQALDMHQLKKSLKLQAGVTVGDAVLDRGVRNAKARMRLELKLSSGSSADFVFGSNLDNIVQAGLRSEPQLVRDCANRFEQVPDFNGKAELKKDLEERASRQIKALEERDEGELIRNSFRSALVRTIADCSDALYKLEKLMLARFARERGYVRSFFLDVSYKRKLKPEDEDPPTVQTPVSN
jgi:hypothetical protein